MAEPPPSPEPAPAEGDGFRWPALFQRSVDAVFVLNRRRQIQFVNRAWEALTGLAAREVHQRICRRQRDASPGSCEAVQHALAPPREVLEGKPARLRRLAVGADGRPQYWDISFLPLAGAKGIVGVLGRIRTVAIGQTTGQPVLPEKLVAVRERWTGWFGLEHLASEVPAVRRLAEQVRLASRVEVPVLLVGEPGAGKQWLARTIHVEGGRREQAFFALDCRLPPPALAWALLGPPGLARREGATLYLQEPAALPRDLQGRLCEVTAEEQPGPRFLAGMSADPAAEVRAGRLLEAMHCLLSPLTIAVPPLRERLPDLPVFAERLLARAASGHDRAVNGISGEAWELLRAYAWPGNLRELYAVLAAGCRRCQADRIEAGDLPWYLRPAPAAAERTLPLDALLENVERSLSNLALAMARGDESKAAELLAMWRPRLSRRMEALEIDES